MDDDDAARLLREAQAKPDDVDVSEFFGGTEFDDLFATLSAEEVKELERVIRNDEVVARTPDLDPEDDELFFDDD